MAPVSSPTTSSVPMAPVSSPTVPRTPAPVSSPTVNIYSSVQTSNQIDTLSCSANFQTQVNDGGKCYKVNGKEACDYSQTGMNSISSLSSSVSCIISAIVIFISFGMKDPSGKLMLGITIGCALSGLSSFIFGNLQKKQIIKDKPLC
jgi:hypothetical protein